MIQRNKCRLFWFVILLVVSTESCNFFLLPDQAAITPPSIPQYATETPIDKPTFIPTDTPIPPPTPTETGDPVIAIFLYPLRAALHTR